MFLYFVPGFVCLSPLTLVLRHVVFLGTWPTWGQLTLLEMGKEEKNRSFSCFPHLPTWQRVLWESVGVVVLHIAFFIELGVFLLLNVHVCFLAVAIWSFLCLVEERALAKAWSSFSSRELQASSITCSLGIFPLCSPGLGRDKGNPRVVWVPPGQSHPGVAGGLGRAGPMQQHAGRFWYLSWQHHPSGSVQIHKKGAYKE